MKLKRFISAITMTAIMVSSTAILRADAVTVTQKHYYKYTYATNTRTDYWLTLEDTLPTTTPYYVIDDDERFRDGNDGVVGVRVNGTVYGTGFIVGDHVIATAAHCLFNKVDNSNASTYDFRPNVEISIYNGSGIYTGTSFTAVEAHVPVLYEAVDSTYSQRHDYALITVAEDLSEYTHFNLGYAYDVEDDHDIPVLVTGFPGDLNKELGDNGLDPLMYTSPGYLYTPAEAQNPVDDLLYHSSYTVGGNSGGPVYTITEYTVGTNTYQLYTAIGLTCVAGGFANWGPRITSPLIQFYLNNNNINY